MCTEEKDTHQFAMLILNRMRIVSYEENMVCKLEKSLVINSAITAPLPV